MENQSKVCTKCKLEKRVTDFYKKKRKNKVGIYAHCKDCHAKLGKLWIEKNRDKVRKVRRKYYDSNKERMYELGKEKGWYTYKPDDYQKNKQRIRAYAKQWHKENGHRYKGKRADWKKNNLERVRFYNRKREANLAKASGSFSYDEWELMKRASLYRCQACYRSEPDIKLTIDHIKPLSKGGSHNKSNIQPLCLSCNCSKHDKEINYRHAI